MAGTSNSLRDISVRCTGIQSYSKLKKTCKINPCKIINIARDLFVEVEIFLGCLVHLLQTLAHHVIREPLLTLLIHTLRGTLVTHVGPLHHLQPEAHCHLSQLCREEVLITLLFLLLDHGYIISVLMLRTVNTAIKL